MGVFQTPDFRKIKSFWYKKLKESGFIEIEDLRRNTLKVLHSNYFLHRYCKETFLFKGAYFRKASYFLEHYQFESDLSKEVWALHSEGISMRKISQQSKLNLSAIHEMISNLRKKMKEIE